MAAVHVSIPSRAAAHRPAVVPVAVAIIAVVAAVLASASAAPAAHAADAAAPAATTLQRPPALLARLQSDVDASHRVLEQRRTVLGRAALAQRRATAARARQTQQITRVVHVLTLVPGLVSDDQADRLTASVTA